jgi:hypothetical protein
MAFYKEEAGLGCWLLYSGKTDSLKKIICCKAAQLALARGQRTGCGLGKE